MVFITALQDKVQMTFQVEQHRELLRPQVEDKLCAVENISVCGHWDDSELGSAVIQSVTDGNYRHLLRFRMASGDEALKRATTAAAANARYMSKTIQNELLTVMASMVKKSVTPVWSRPRFGAF